MRITGVNLAMRKTEMRMSSQPWASWRDQVGLLQPYWDLQGKLLQDRYAKGMATFTNIDQCSIHCIQVIHLIFLLLNIKYLASGRYQPSIRFLPLKLWPQEHPSPWGLMRNAEFHDPPEGLNQNLHFNKICRRFSCEKHKSQESVRRQMIHLLERLWLKFQSQDTCKEWWSTLKLVLALTIPAEAGAVGESCSIVPMVFVWGKQTLPNCTLARI